LHGLALYTVFLPTLLAAAYYGPVASDVYISESRLVMRSPHQQAVSAGLGSLLQGIGASRDDADTYSVRDFILSRDALKKLNAEFHVDKAFGSDKVDLLKRFAGLDWWNTTFEALYRYYTNRVVTVEVEPSSDIVTLTVRAFSPQEAHQINERLVQMSEELVNKLNERARQDMMRFAMADVEAAEKKAEAAALAVARYRNARAVFNPEKQSPLHLERIAKLEDQLIVIETQLAQLRAVTPDNPQISTLGKQAESLRQVIDAESSKLTGGGMRSLSNQAADYERLAFAQEFAQKQLAAALASLEQVRNEARRKQLYLERLVEPGLPDFPLEPRRARSVLTTFVVGVVAWGALSILIAGVREHRD
jgi:capsular polysaccharide transport system permease protein